MGFESKFGTDFGNLDWHEQEGDQAIQALDKDLKLEFGTFESNQKIEGSASDSIFGSSDSIFGSSSSSFGSSNSSFGSSGSIFGSTNSSVGSSSSSISSTSSNFGSSSSIFGSSNSSIGSSSSSIGSSNSSIGNTSTLSSSTVSRSEPSKIAQISSPPLKTLSSGASIKSYASQIPQTPVVAPRIPKPTVAPQAQAPKPTVVLAAQESGTPVSIKPYAKGVQASTNRNRNTQVGQDSRQVRPQAVILSGSEDLQNSILTESAKTPVCSASNTQVRQDSRQVSQDSRQVRQDSRQVRQDSRQVSFQSAFLSHSEDIEESIVIGSAKPQVRNASSAVKVSAEMRRNAVSSRVIDNSMDDSAISISKHVSVPVKQASSNGSNNLARVLLSKRSPADIWRSVQRDMEEHGCYNVVSTLSLNQLKYNACIVLVVIGLGIGLLSMLYMSIVVFIITCVIVLLLLFYANSAKEANERIYKTDIVRFAARSYWGCEKIDWKPSEEAVKQAFSAVKLFGVPWNVVKSEGRLLANYRGHSIDIHHLTLSYRERISKNEVESEVFKGQIYVFPLKYEMPCRLYITERTFQNAPPIPNAKVFKSGHPDFDQRFRLELDSWRNSSQDPENRQIMATLLKNFQNMLSQKLLIAFLRMDDLAESDTRMIFSEDKLYVLHANRRTAFKCPNIDRNMAQDYDLISNAGIECEKTSRLWDVLIEQIHGLLSRK